LNLPGGWELVLVLLVVMLLFGSKRLPDSARALGRSLRILKAETKGLRSDDDTVIEAEKVETEKSKDD
jgi:sec-independent protein translocase protein TatA